MCWRDSVPDEGLMPAWTAWIYHTVAASGRGGQVSTASKQWRVGLRQQQQPRRRWQPAGEAYPHGPHEAAIVG